MEYWWLNPWYRGGVKKRVGVYINGIYCYYIIYNDGTRTDPVRGVGKPSNKRRKDANTS